MKVLRLVLLSCLFCARMWATVADQPARTIFIPRPKSANALYTEGFSLLATHDVAHDRVLLLGHTAFFETAPQSTKVGPYFFGGAKEYLKVDENGTGDINSDWLHLDPAVGATYTSLIRVYPKRSVAGVCFRAQYILDALLNGLWVGFVAPLVHAIHELQPVEQQLPSTVLATTSQFSSALSCFDWINWRAGKWSGQSQSITGFDDVVCQIGFDIYGPRDSIQQIALELVVPVGDRPTAQYLFEPLIGSQGSFALGGSVKTITQLFEFDKKMRFSLVSYLCYRYLFQSHQLRLFDLKGQPFSRYLVYMDTALSPDIANVQTKAANGQNFFVRDALVIPGAMGQSITALQCQIAQHQCTLGYLYWWRTAEQVSFAGSSTRSFAVPSPQGLNTGGAQLWLTDAQVVENFSSLDAAVYATPSPTYDIEFDVDSGTTPHMSSNLLYVDYTSSFVRDAGTYSVRLGTGYEFSSGSAVLNSWHVWGGVGLTI